MTQNLLAQWVEKLENKPGSRKFVIKSIQEFLQPPVIYVKRDQLDMLDLSKEKLLKYARLQEENKPSAVMVFDDLESREKACLILSENGIHFRTGKALVPFRLTGSVEWGVPAPCLEGLENLTIWV